MMSTDFVKSILDVSAAIIPLIILIVSLFRRRLQTTTYQIDNPSLHVLQLTRNPVNEKDWQHFHRKNLHPTSSYFMMVMVNRLKSEQVLR
jgi:hypothetical protein